MSEWLLAGYLAGVVIGLVVMRDRWPTRIVIAAAWPLGIAAFGVVIATLVAASFYLWPVPMFATAAVIAAIWLAV